MRWDALTIRNGRFHSGRILEGTNGQYTVAGDRAAGPTSDAVAGQFMGENHREVVGLFHRNGIADAFAAQHDEGATPDAGTQ